MIKSKKKKNIGEPKAKLPLHFTNAFLGQHAVELLNAGKNITFHIMVNVNS